MQNAALRQQLAVFKRHFPRPKLANRDRLFWIGLYLIGQDWKSALMIVQPETVTSWHHKRFRRYWWKLSQPKQTGRPRTGAEIRKLARTSAIVWHNAGHNKQGRHNLRQVGLSYVLDGEHGISLCHHVYAGNVADVEELPKALQRIVKMLDRHGIERSSVSKPMFHTQGACWLTNNSHLTTTAKAVS